MTLFDGFPLWTGPPTHGGVGVSEMVAHKTLSLNFVSGRPVGVDTMTCDHLDEGLESYETTLIVEFAPCPKFGWYEEGDFGWYEEGTHRKACPQNPLATIRLGDVLTLVSSPKHHFDADGRMVLAPANTPAIDHDPISHAPRGLLLEGPAENMVTKSARFDDPAWSPARLIVEDDAGTTPKPGVLCQKLVPTSVYGTHQVFQNVTFALGEGLIVSAIAKPSELSKIDFVVVEAGDYVRGRFDLATREATAIKTGVVFEEVTAKIKDYGNGSLRLILAFETVTITGAKVIMRLPGEEWATQWSGDNVSGLFLWAGQVEKGRGAMETSYIATDDLPVTRARDIAVIDKDFSWATAAEGTVQIEAEIPSGTHTGPGLQLLSLNDGTPDNAISLRVRGLGLDGYDNKVDLDGSTLATADGGDAPEDGTPIKVAASYKVSDWASPGEWSSAAHGVTLTTATNQHFSAPPITQLTLGGETGSLWVRGVGFYSKYFSQLEGITA